MLEAKYYSVLRFCKTLLIVFSLVTFPTYARAAESLSAEDYRTRGFEAQQKGNLEDALAYYLKALSLDPINPVVLNDLGILYEQTGFSVQAEEYYLRALKVNKDYLPTYLNLGYFYLNQGKREQAFLYFKSRYERGSLRDEWGEKAKEELLKIKPSYKEWTASRERAWRDEEIVTSSLNEIDPKIEEAKAKYQEALDYMKAEMYEEALQSFDAYLQIIPDDYKAIDMKSQLQLKIAAAESEPRQGREREEKKQNETDVQDVQEDKSTLDELTATDDEETSEE